MYSLSNMKGDSFLDSIDKKFSKFQGASFLDDHALEKKHPGSFQRTWPMYSLGVFKELGLCIVWERMTMTD